MTRFLLAVVLLGSACAPSTLGGSLRPDGYHHNLLPIHLRSTGQETQFVSPDWRLDNFRNGTSGWEQKTGPGYSQQVVVDLREGGDKRTHSIVDRPAFDVLLTQRYTGAQLWMRTELLPESYAQRTLESLVAPYAEQLSGTAFVGVSIAAGSSSNSSATAISNSGSTSTSAAVSAGVSRAYATKIVSSGPTKVGDRDAYEAVIELANLDQLRLDPASRSSILHVVFVNGDYRVFQSDLDGVVWGRAIVVLGYSAPPAAYDKSHDDFARFREAVLLGPPDRKGYSL